MRSAAALILAVHTCSLAALAGARQDPAPPQATFRTGVDVIQLDVSVLAKSAVDATSGTSTTRRTSRFQVR